MKAKNIGQETGLPLYTLLLFPKLNQFLFFCLEITGFHRGGGGGEWGMLWKYWILVQILQFTEEEAEAQLGKELDQIYTVKIV